MTTKTIEGPSQADREAARTLAARGGPFSPIEYATLELLDPNERSTMRYRTVAPSVDLEREAIDKALTAKHGADIEKAEEGVATARRRREAAEVKIFAAAPPIDPSVGRWFLIDQAPRALKDELREARQLEEFALARRADLNEQVADSRRQLHAERALNRKK